MRSSSDFDSLDDKFGAWRKFFLTGFRNFKVEAGIFLSQRDDKRHR